MSDADRALAPLDEARAAITKLDTYEKPQELAEALEAIGQAVERSLRQLLRLDPSLPDDVRLHARDAEQLPYDRVLGLLRQRERISLSLANDIHELRQGTLRAGAGTVRASDADHAIAVVGRVRSEILAGPSGMRSEAARDDAVRAATHGAVERGEFEEPAHEVSSRARRWPLRVAMGVALFALGFLVYGATTGWFGESELEQGVAAFREGRMGIAERHFRAALKEGESATAELYLGRVLRREGRLDEAGAVLNAARKRYPQDADLLRELGYLLALDLRRPAAAVEPFRRAVELQPEQDANWVGLVRALRATGDPAAEQWLARAPATAQAVLRTNQP